MCALMRAGTLCWMQKFRGTFAMLPSGLRSAVCIGEGKASCENNCSPLCSHPVGNTKLQLSRSHMEEPKLCGGDYLGAF